MLTRRLAIGGGVAAVLTRTTAGVSSANAQTVTTAKFLPPEAAKYAGQFGLAEVKTDAGAFVTPFLVDRDISGKYVAIAVVNYTGSGDDSTAVTQPFSISGIPFRGAFHNVGGKLVAAARTGVAQSQQTCMDRAFNHPNGLVSALLAGGDQPLVPDLAKIVSARGRMQSSIPYDVFLSTKSQPVGNDICTQADFEQVRQDARVIDFNQSATPRFMFAAAARIVSINGQPVGPAMQDAAVWLRGAASNGVIALNPIRVRLTP